MSLKETKSVYTVVLSSNRKDYADILEILATMASECGSATNAAALCIRESGRFQRAKAAFEQANDSANRQAAEPK
jgi:hypothetical protein